MAQSKRWCFTLNNYDEAELVALRTSLSQEKVRYAVFGKEVGEGGTPHLQGYFSCKTHVRFKAAKAMVSDRAHIEVAKGNEEQNIKYCTKDNNFEEFGQRNNLKKTQGKRTDIESFKDAVKSGVLDIKTLREDFSEVFAKYPRFFHDYIRDQTPLPDIPYHPLFPWQQDLNHTLNRKPDDRKIIFIVDYEGNQGKSWFAKYYCRNFNDAVILRPTKHADMAYALPPILRVLFLDCTRTQVEHLPYSFIEQVKDGLVFSNKYESVIKHYGLVHVVVLMNKDPDLNALSSDRYEIIKLE